jgi:hypothetical protein
MLFEGIVGIMGWKVLGAQLHSLALLKWSKNLPMNGENKTHMRHMKILPK